MAYCCFAEQGFHIYFSISGLEAYKKVVPDLSTEQIPPVPLILSPSYKSTKGWVAGKDRLVETWNASPGIIIKTDGGSDFYIGPDGQDIVCVGQESGSTLNDIDRQILLGPVIVMALAMRRTWSLHASAAMFGDKVIAFLGESGQGKSTLAAYLADQPGWRLVADDILPVASDDTALKAFPRFPQLKLPMDAQPGVDLPESLPLERICVLAEAGLDEEPALELLPASQAAQVLVGHTAGTRLFDPELLAKHLQFCAGAATQVQVYRLKYPHRKDKLPHIKELLESIC